MKKLNATTWEELNPDWKEDGDLTDRFAKSQFDSCPGCGEYEIGVYVATEELDVAVNCRKCGWHVYGDCPSEAIDKWNQRAQSREDVASALAECESKIQALIDGCDRDLENTGGEDRFDQSVRTRQTALFHCRSIVQQALSNAERLLNG